MRKQRFAFAGRVFNFAQTYAGIVCNVCFMKCNRAGVLNDKPEGTKKQAGVSHPGMMGDGTEEQNLNERGNPAARIKKDEVDAAFGKRNPKK